MVFMRCDYNAKLSKYIGCNHEQYNSSLLPVVEDWNGELFFDAEIANKL